MTRLFAGTPFDIPPTCEQCGALESDCSCTPEDKAAEKARRQREADHLPPEKQTARIEIQKRKGGRRATVVTGLTTKANDMPALLKQLQSACGVGGTVRASEDTVELQGAHIEKVRQVLRDLGYRVK